MGLGTPAKVTQWAREQGGYVNVRQEAIDGTPHRFWKAFLNAVEPGGLMILCGWGKTPDQAKGNLWDTLVGLGIVTD